MRNYHQAARPVVKLAASLIVRNELGRYLEPCIDHLAEFCDLIVVWDDGSDDDTITALAGRHDAIRLHGTIDSTFFRSEGQVRQALLEATLSWSPTHVLAIDADEFVSDGPALRQFIERRPESEFAVEIAEVWKVFDECLCIRQDGGWRPHPTPALWRVPRNPRGLRIANRPLACGRVPVEIDRRAGRAYPTGVQLLHFGWANAQERRARHRRYAIADGGRYHRSQHLDSILWPDRRVAMHGQPWPEGLTRYRDAILAHATKGAAHV